MKNNRAFIDKCKQEVKIIKIGTEENFLKPKKETIIKATGNIKFSNE